jgi:hypothetical protein
LDADHATPLSDAWVFDPAKREWAVAVGASPSLTFLHYFLTNLTHFLTNLTLFLNYFVTVA